MISSPLIDCLSVTHWMTADDVLFFVSFGPFLIFSECHDVRMMSM